MKAARHTQSKSPHAKGAVDPRLLPFLDTLAEALAAELLREQVAAPAPRKNPKAK